MGEPLLSQEELYQDLRRHMDDGQEMTRYEYPVAGGTAVGMALLHGYRRPAHLGAMYRTAGMHGTMVERTDDAIDGDHGFDTVEDRRQFLYTGLDVLETGERPDTVSGAEAVAYRAAEHVNSLLTSEQAATLRHGTEEAAGLEDVVEATLEEQTTAAGYETHLDSAAYLFENMGLMLDMSTPYELDGHEEFWSDTGRVLQGTDDRVDGDWDGIVDTHERQRDLLDAMRADHGAVPAMAVSAGDTVFRVLGALYLRSQ